MSLPPLSLLFAFLSLSFFVETAVLVSSSHKVAHWTRRFLFFLLAVHTLLLTLFSASASYFACKAERCARAERMVNEWERDRHG